MADQRWPSGLIHKYKTLEMQMPGSADGKPLLNSSCRQARSWNVDVVSTPKLKRILRKSTVILQYSFLKYKLTMYTAQLDNGPLQQR